MKNISIKKSIEFILELFDDQWHQGDIIKGQVLITNHSAQDKKIDNLYVHLVQGNSKKIKSHGSDAFKALSPFSCKEMINILPNEKTLFPFEMALKNDCPIKDSLGGVFIIFSENDSPNFEDMMLELDILPNKIILSFVEIFENFFRFKSKGFKNKKNMIEAKFIVPDSKEFSSVLNLTLQLKISESDLLIIFMFKLKKVSFDDGIVGTKDSFLEIKKTMTKKQYEFDRNSPNQQSICNMLENVLEQIKVKPLI